MFDLKLSEHHGIWDYKANRIMMEGMALKDQESDDEYFTGYEYEEEEEEEEDLGVDDEWYDEVEDEEDFEWLDEYPYDRSKLEGALDFGDLVVDDEAVSIPLNQSIESVSDLFDFFQKEMVIDNPSTVRVHVC